MKNIELKDLSAYKNLIIGLAIVVIFVIAVRKVLFRYSLQKSEVAVQMREIEDGEITLLRWSKLKADAEELARGFFVEDTSLLGKFIENKARASRVNIGSLKTSSSESDLSWQILMQLGITCNYSDFVTFIKAIEEKSVVIERATVYRGDQKGKVKIDLALKGFILKK
ncbi:MAG: hypothetical protein ABIE75_01900 [Candidatus Omnitrophota bacterium]